MLQKPIPAQGGQPASAGGLADVWMSEEYPLLWDYLTQDKWPDGTGRVTSTLLLFVEDGQLKACLNDRDGERAAFFCSGSMEGLLGAVEAALKGDYADWRIKRESKPRRK